MKKKNGGSKRIIGLVIFVIAAVLLIGSVTGYVVRGQQSTADLLTQMRTEAVLKTASSGLIDAIAAEARLAKNKELRKDKNFRKMGTDAFQALCQEAEDAARAEAEQLYSDTTGVDQSALAAAIPAVEEALAAYNAKVAEENSVYAEIYEKLLDGGLSWSELSAKSEDEIWAALLETAPALSEHEAWKSGLLRMVSNLAAQEAEQELQETLSQVWSSITGTITDWSVYAEKSDDELWAALVEAAPVLADETTAVALKSSLLEYAKQSVEGNVPETSDSSDEAEAETEITIDYSYYTQSEAVQALEEGVNTAYAEMMAVIAQGIPALSELSDKNAESIRETILEVITVSDGDFSERYTVYSEAGASGQSFIMVLASHAENLLLLGSGLLLIALLIYFWTPITAKLGVSRAIILLFFICLLLAAQYYKINISLMLGNILERVSMYGVLVLAMLPSIQCGIGLNMGMTIGCVSGLFAVVTALNYNMTGWTALFFSIILGALLAIPLGWAYSLLLNRMKGSEMTISTYVGFSFVSLMCMVWMAIPYKNPKIIWMLAGHGLRVTHSLLGVFAHQLDNLGAFTVLGVEVPLGGILFFLLFCLIMYVFTRSKIGIRMKAVGSNPRFAEASGINVDSMRTIGVILSTVLAAIGIVVYSQAFGYAQLYNAPKQLGFIAASAILIGGASVKKAKVSHVIIGVVLFEGVLSLGQQVANEAVSGGGLSEVMRIMVSNGIILYALTQSGGEQNG